MIYKTDTLISDLHEILNDGEQFIFPDITYTLHTATEDFVIQQPLHLDIKKDYGNNFFDVVDITFSMQAGDYRDIILYNKDNLEVTIDIDYKDTFYDREYLKTGVFLNKDYGYRFYNKRYKLIITDFKNKYLTPKYKKLDRDELNKMDLVTVKATCIPLIGLYIKPIVVSGTLWDVTVEDFLKRFMTYHLSKVKTNTGLLDFRLIIDPPDNIDIFNHIKIKSNTKLLTVPEVMQNGEYGIYTGSINLYIDERNTNDVWIFPKYGGYRFNSTLHNKLILLTTVREGYGANEITYHVKPNSTEYYQIPTNVEVVDKGLFKSYTNFNAIYVRNPNNLFNIDMFNITDDKIEFNVDQFVSLNKWNDDDSGIVQILDGNYDSNYYKYASMLSEYNQMLIAMDISNIDPRIYNPGMKVQYSYDDGTAVYNKFGILQSVQYTYNIAAKSAAGKLFIAIDRKDQT